jgi:CarD family transcriptional regulator
MFKEGDLAVYPAHGVGRIEAVETKEMNQKKRDFYMMRILENGMLIMIPTENEKAVGLRCLIDNQEVSKVYEVLRSRVINVDNQTWNRRYREYMEKIKTGSVFEVAAVLRDLCLLKTDKTLSFGERKMLDTARSLLVKELALAAEMAEEKIEQDLRGIFDS